MPMPPTRGRTLQVKYELPVIVLALAALVVMFFWRMAFTNLILPRGDVFTYFYPYWDYRNAALRAGHLPLWNPLLFMGVPFLANSQAGVLYPPNWFLIFFDTPTAVKVAIVTHTIWAAIGTYFFARNILKTSLLASVLAGACFALSGYLTAQAEHVNQLQGLAWLPWVFWLWTEASHNKRVVLWLGLAWAFQLLAGHTQSAFITGVGLALWAAAQTATAVFPHLRQRPKPTVNHVWQAVSWQQWVALGGAACLALLVSAVQILPTAELAQLSNRGGGLPFLDAISFSLRPQILGRAFLPGYGEQSLSSEYVAYPGIATLILALIGARSTHHLRLKRELIFLGIAGIFLAFGAYNPVYWILVKVVPGFDLFRAPARWLVLWSFAAALLAALGLDQISMRQSMDWHGIVGATGTIAVLGILTLLAPLAAGEVAGASIPSFTEAIIWLSTSVVAVGLVIHSYRLKKHMSSMATTGLAALAVIELFLAARALPYNHLSAPEAWNSQRPSISTLLAAEVSQNPPARFLSMSDTRFDPGDLREMREVYAPYLTEDDLYDYIIATKQKEIIAPNLPMAWGIPSMDGFDGGILPTRDYSQFTALLLDGTETPDGRLREYLETIPQSYWLSISNVRYVITDKVFDAWIDGIYYDLQFRADQHTNPDLPSPQPVTAHMAHPFSATSLGIVGHLEGAANVPQGSQIGTVSIYWDDMSSDDLPLALPLLVGKDFAEGDRNSPAANDARIVGYFTREAPDLGEYHTVAQWETALPVNRVEVSTVSSFPATLVIRGMTLIDDRSLAFQPVGLFDNIHTIQSGDVKIYEYVDSRPRAYLACDPIIVDGQEEALNALPHASRDNQIIVEDGNSEPTANCDPSATGTAEIISYQPERISVAVDNVGRGAYLILSDAWYPGWSATIDGHPSEILRANAIFRALQLSEGDHVVEFRYQSTPLLVGGAISIISLIGIIGGLLWWKPAYDES